MQPNNSLVRTIAATLAADLAAAGTVNVSYPSGFNENHFSPVGHKIAIKNGGQLLQGRDFAVTFTKDYVTITAATGFSTLVAGTELFVELALKGFRQGIDPTILGAAGNRVSRRELLEVNFGAPITADVDGITSVQLANTTFTLDGAQVVNGVAILDVPRNVTLTVATTDHSGKTVTITGTDEYGNAMKETITGPNNNTVQGKKAFKTITSAVASAQIATNGISIGFGDVLGFPVFVPNAVNILYDTEDGAAVTDGTYVAGVLTKPTATTGDVRGTYDPNSACNGDKNFSVVLVLDNPDFLGVPQYAG